MHIFTVLILDANARGYTLLAPNLCEYWISTDFLLIFWQKSVIGESTKRQNDIDISGC